MSIRKIYELPKKRYADVVEWIQNIIVYLERELLLLWQRANTIDANTDLADNIIYSRHIVDGEVKTVDIDDYAVTNAKLGPDAVTTDKIKDKEVKTADIDDLAVTNIKLGPDAVTTDKILNGTIKVEDQGEFRRTLTYDGSRATVNPGLGPVTIDFFIPTATFNINSINLSAIQFAASPKTLQVWINNGAGYVLVHTYTAAQLSEFELKSYFTGTGWKIAEIRISGGSTYLSYALQVVVDTP